jgi:hypothetical protein
MSHTFEELGKLNSIKKMCKGCAHLSLLCIDLMHDLVIIALRPILLIKRLC